MKRYSKPLFHNHFPFFLIKCIVLLVAYNAVSCQCGSTKTLTTIQVPPINNNTSQEEIGKPIDLTLAAGKTFIRGNEPTQLKVTNNGIQSTVWGALKLKVTRTAGSHASIAGATDQGSGQYEIALGTVAPKSNISQDLTIVPGADIKATFKLQLIYEGKDVDNSAVDIIWEKGTSIELKEVKYDETTGYITYSLANSGSEPVRQVKLKYKNKTTGIQVDGVDLKNIDQEITVDIADNLAPGDKKEHQNLAKLVFGTHAKADFEFTVIYEGGSITPEKHTFTPVEIKLSLELGYNKNNGEITYRIKNIGDNVAKNVKLIYNNVSTSIEEQTVLLGGQTSAETAPEELVAKTGETTTTLPIDFKAEAKARFEFKVVCDGITLEHLTKTEEFKAPEVNLELIPAASPNTNAIHLEDNNKEFKVKINQKTGSGLVDPKQLKLTITPSFKGKGVLSTTSGGVEITELAEKQLGTIGDEIALYVNPSGDDPVEFTLRLYYKTKSVGNPITVRWKAKEVKLRLSLIDPKPLSADQQFIQLAEEQKLIKLKITPQTESGQTDLTHLKLAISRITGNQAVLSTSLGGSQVTELTGSQLGSIGDELTLYLHPRGNEQFEFKLQLLYKGKLQSIPLRLGWEKLKLELYDLNKVVGNEPGSFKIRRLSAAVLSPEDITVSVHSDNSAEFVLLAKNGSPLTSPSSATLQQLGYPTQPMKFKLQDPKGKKEAKVTITVTKKGNADKLAEQLAKQLVNWEERGVDMQVTLTIPTLKGVSDPNDTYLSDNLIEVTLTNKAKVGALTDKIRVKIENPQGLTISVNDINNNYNNISTGIDCTLTDIVGYAELKGATTPGNFKLAVVGHPTKVNSAELVLSFEDDKGKVFYTKKLIWINSSILSSRDKIKNELTSLSYSKLENSIKDYKEVISDVTRGFYLQSIIEAQGKAKAIRKQAEELANTVQTTVPDPLLASSLESSIRKQMLVPTENIVEKGDEFLGNLMKNLQNQVKGFLQEGKLQQAASMFENAQEISQLLDTAENKQIIENIYEQIFLKLKEKSNTYSNPTTHSNNPSEAIEIAEIAEKIGKGTQPFIKKDELTAIATKAYTVALDILDRKLTNDPYTTAADYLLRDAKKLTNVAKTYGLDTSKMDKVNKAAYAVAAQAKLVIAKGQKEKVSKTITFDNALNYAELARQAATEAAALDQEAKANKFESKELTQAVQEAYIAAAQTGLAVANGYKGTAESGVVTPTSYHAEQALKAASLAAAIAQEAKGFTSPELTQAIQEAYTVAAQVQLAVAKSNKKMAELGDIGPRSFYARKAFEAASGAAAVAQEAAKKVFGSPDPKMNKAVQEAYAAAAQAELDIVNYNKGLVKNHLFAGNTFAEGSLEAANRAAAVAQQAKTNGFESNETNQAVKEAYTAAAQAKLDIANYNKGIVKNHLSSGNTFGERSLKAANGAAAVAQQAKTNGFENPATNQAAQEAYAAAAQVELDIANYNKGMVKNHLSSGNTFAEGSLKAANRADAVAQQAKTNGFENPATNQAVKEAYTAAAQAELAIAKDYAKKVQDSSYGKEDNANKSLEAANRAAKVAQQAKTNGFENPETNQAVKDAYTAALEAYQALKDNKNTATIKKIEDIIKLLP